MCCFNKEIAEMIKEALEKVFADLMQWDKLTAHLIGLKESMCSVL